MSEARHRFGIDELRPGQDQLFRAVLDGRDAIGVLPTGAGKSLCFQLPAICAKVVAALLESMGIAERQRGRVRVVRTFRDDSELARFLGEYEARHRGDRARLDAIVRYMQTTSCRGQLIEAYFGEPAPEMCGHCDNCETGAAAQAAAIANARARPRRREAPPLVATTTLHVGEQVKHRRFGVGEVKAVDGQSVTVVFPRGEKTVRAGWLSPAQAA